MALRLIEMVLREEAGRGNTRELLKEHKVLEHRQVRLPDGEMLVRLLMEAEQSETVLDVLEQQLAGLQENRVVILPVEATLPGAGPAPPATSGQPSPEKKAPERIAREELYETIKNAARCSRVYLAMTVLSIIVATVGLQHNSVAIIIGAMVMAPLLGPNMAVAFSTTLGDISLLRQAPLIGVAGIAAAMGLSVLIGGLQHDDLRLSKVASRTQVGLGDIAVGLASGCAGALAFTTGVPATLIGVIVAVALLPPLVTFGLLGWARAGIRCRPWARCRFFGCAS